MTAGSSEEAFAIFKKRSKDIKLVILDVMMPVMDGKELLTALRGVRPDVKILLTSGYIESVAQERVQDARVCGFLQKPYSSRTLGDFVRKALDET